MKIIVSIHDKHLENIKQGKKVIEVRKDIPKSRITIKASGKMVTTKRENEGVFLYWYNTKTKKIEGISQFTYTSYIKITEGMLSLEEATRITPQELKAYLGEERDHFYLWYLGEYKSLEPYKLPEGKKAPQSWCYYNTIFKAER